MKAVIKSIYVLVLLVVMISCSKDDDVVTPEVPEPSVATLSSISPTSGPKQTSVTINGNNFGTTPNQVQVFFNEVEAEVQSVSNTQIVATVPARAYTGVVKVIIDNTELNGPEFTYLISETVVSTHTGSSPGNTNGNGTNAQFSYPTNMAQDSQGNLFIIDNQNYSIKKITPNGDVSLFAGGDSGTQDGTGAEAKFSTAYGIAIDVQDNIYLADTYNHRIRKITPNAEVTTIAGSTIGDVDGTEINSKFYRPGRLVVDDEMTVYVSDGGNHKVRKITQE